MADFFIKNKILAGSVGNVDKLNTDLDAIKDKLNEGLVASNFAAGQAPIDAFPSDFKLTRTGQVSPQPIYDNYGWPTPSASPDGNGGIYSGDNFFATRESDLTAVSSMGDGVSIGGVPSAGGDSVYASAATGLFVPGLDADELRLRGTLWVGDKVTAATATSVTFKFHLIHNNLGVVASSGLDQAQVASATVVCPFGEVTSFDVSLWTGAVAGNGAYFFEQEICHIGWSLPDTHATNCGYVFGGEHALWAVW